MSVLRMLAVGRWAPFRGTGRAKCASALFIVGEKATDVCVVVNPHVEWSGDTAALRDNLSRRAAPRVDVEQLGEAWEAYATLRAAKEHIDKRLEQLSAALKDLQRSHQAERGEQVQREVTRLRGHYAMAKEDMRTLRASLWCAEEKAVLGVLALPNLLHPHTPDMEPAVVEQHGESPSMVGPPASHIEVGLASGLLTLCGPHAYYLHGEAALFELALKFYFSDFLRTRGYIQFSNADLVKSVVVEGCGGDPSSVFLLHQPDQRAKPSEELSLHLVGGGSLCAFAAYHTRNIIPAKMLPLRYFATGRHYSPRPPAPTAPGLFGAAQSSVVEIFSLLPNSGEALEEELNRTTETISRIYRNIGMEFRVCRMPAPSLAKWESLRLSYQMFSASLGSFVEVGHISVAGDYVSKRLQLLYRDNTNTTHFTNVLSGTVVCAPPLLACALEALHPFHIPQVLKRALPSVSE